MPQIAKIILKSLQHSVIKILHVTTLKVLQCTTFFALIHKTVLTYLRFSPLNSLSKNLLNWSFPAGSWSNSSILNAHRFTLRCGISRGFLNSLHRRSCIGSYYIAILFHTTIITCTCKLIIKSDSWTLYTIFFPEFFSSSKFIKQEHILLHSMVANCSKDIVIVRMH